MSFKQAVTCTHALAAVITLCVSSVSASAALSTQQTEQDSNPAAAFDFWLGEWETEMSNAPNWEKKTGRDVVTSHLRGKLLEEVFTRNPDGENFQRGYLFYLQREQKWQHIIYDANYGEFRFLGGPTTDDNGKPTIVLQSPDDDTRPGKHKETFSNLSKDSFDYTWESSPDGGKTWQVQWKVKYRRKTAGE